jgi:hypothetical protein
LASAFRCLLPATITTYLSRLLPWLAHHITTVKPGEDMATVGRRKPVKTFTEHDGMNSGIQEVAGALRWR